MPTYVVGDIHITDLPAFQTHAPRALATIARFGGRVIAGGGRIDLFEGYRASRLRAGIRFAEMPRKDRLLGSGGAMQCAKTRLDLRHGRVSQCRRHLHRLHDPGLPDKFMQFMDEPPGGVLSSILIRPYGELIRRLRRLTNNTFNEEPKWRHNRPELTTGYRSDRPIPRPASAGA